MTSKPLHGPMAYGWMGKLGVDGNRLRILMGRGVLVSARPLALLVAAAVSGSAAISGFTTLIAWIPLLLAAMSLPVHRGFYLQCRTGAKRAQAAATKYVADATAILVVSSLAMLALAMVITGSISLALAAMLVMVSEKLFDEIMRWFEFSKDFDSWLAAAITRNAWCWIFPILLMAGVSPRSSLLFSCYCASFSSVAMLFYSTNRVPFKLEARAIASQTLRVGDYSHELKLLGFSTFRSGVRTLDRMIFSRLFVEHSAYLVAASMVASSAYILFDAMCFAPRRKLIAHKPMEFLKRFGAKFVHLAGRVIFATTFFALALWMLARSEWAILGCLMLVNVTLGLATQPAVEVFFWSAPSRALNSVLLVTGSSAVAILVGLLTLGPLLKGSVVAAYCIVLAATAAYFFIMTKAANSLFRQGWARR